MDAIVDDDSVGEEGDQDPSALSEPQTGQNPAAAGHSQPHSGLTTELRDVIPIGKCIQRTAVSPVSSASLANGTVVFTTVASPSTGKHVGTLSQAIAVPQSGGGVSIVQLQLPNQGNVVQSVIQPANQQSVIQATGGAVQAVQLPKNVILLNKVGQGSVIHSTDNTDANIHPVQLISTRADDQETITAATLDEESKKRREVLARRPSYRKILNELSSAEAVGITSLTASEVKTEEEAHLERSDSTATITVTSPYLGNLKVVPASAIQLAAGSQDGTLQGIQTLTMTNAGAGATGAIVQYATQGQDGQFFVPGMGDLLGSHPWAETGAHLVSSVSNLRFSPVTVSAADLQAYQIRTTGTGNSSGLTQQVVMTPGINPQHHQVAEEASKKRELRLLKNREAAKECRRKKKEYIKCLENRVAVLENQNKALIEELKSLKELYCQKSE